MILLEICIAATLIFASTTDCSSLTNHLQRTDNAAQQSHSVVSHSAHKSVPISMSHISQKTFVGIAPSNELQHSISYLMMPSAEAGMSEYQPSSANVLGQNHQLVFLNPMTTYFASDGKNSAHELYHTPNEGKSQNNAKQQIQNNHFQPSRDFEQVNHYRAFEHSRNSGQTGPHLFPRSVGSMYVEKALPYVTPKGEIVLGQTFNTELKHQPPNLFSQFQAPFKASQFLGYADRPEIKQAAFSHNQDQTQISSEPNTYNLAALFQADPAIASGKYYHRFVQPVYEPTRSTRSNINYERTPVTNSKLTILSPQSTYAQYKIQNSADKVK